MTQRSDQMPEPEQKSPAVSEVSDNSLMKDIPKSSYRHTIVLVAVSFVVVVAGVATGWFLSGVTRADGGSTKSSQNLQTGTSGEVKEAGIDDESLFEKETPEGILVEGGINGEGTHYLDRGLGPEKNVYLTSTALDLQSFVGKRVRVWGNTVAAQYAPWLMDVGRIKVIE